MVARIRLLREKGKVTMETESIGPLTVLLVTLPVAEGLSHRRLCRRLSRLERDLLRQGVGRVILPIGFPYAHLLPRLRALDALSLYRSTADLLALAWLDWQGISPDRSRIALAAPRLCPELREAAQRLCPQVRELTILVPDEGENYARWLHRRYGLPVTPRSAAANLTLAFGPTEGVSGTMLSLYGTQPELHGLRLSLPDLELPEDCREALMGLLWEAGAVDRTALMATISPESLEHEAVLCYNN